MKERQRWRAEEDAILCAYVKQYGPRDWHLVGQRMNAALHRDAKSCQERWKNYLRPGVKKGALTDEEQRLVIRLQAQYGNKWKKIAAEVPGRTAKRLGKWWEVFKEQQHRVLQRQSGSCAAVEPGKYDSILESFAEKLVEQEEQQHCHRRHTQLMATPLLPAWLSSNNGGAHPRPPSPSVALTLSPATAAAPARAPWQLQAPPEAVNLESGSSPFAAAGFTVDGRVVAELVECCKELEEGHRAWAAQKKEASWRLKRVELQLEAEMAAKRREKMEEMEAKMRALQEEQQAAMERIEAEYRDQIAGLRRDAEAKEQKLAEAWTAKHVRLSNFLDQFGCRRWLPSEINGR